MGVCPRFAFPPPLAGEVAAKWTEGGDGASAPYELIVLPIPPPRPYGPLPPRAGGDKVVYPLLTPALFNRAIRLDVSQRAPPMDWISA